MSTTVYEQGVYLLQSLRTMGYVIISLEVEGSSEGTGASFYHHSDNQLARLMDLHRVCRVRIGYDGIFPIDIDCNFNTTPGGAMLRKSLPEFVKQAIEATRYKIQMAEIEDDLNREEREQAEKCLEAERLAVIMQKIAKKQQKVVDLNKEITHLINLALRK